MQNAAFLFRSQMLVHGHGRFYAPWHLTAVHLAVLLLCVCTPCGGAPCQRVEAWGAAQVASFLNSAARRAAVTAAGVEHYGLDASDLPEGHVDGNVLREMNFVRLRLLVFFAFRCGAVCMSNIFHVFSAQLAGVATDVGARAAARAACHRPAQALRKSALASVNVVVPVPRNGSWWRTAPLLRALWTWEWELICNGSVFRVHVL
eukprot:SAG11_NODE_1800_length_4243_cov_4.590734_2_plen_204_part_00